MKVTMISNYINHHQIPFSQALYERLGEGYRFVQTEPMEEERLAMGWAVEEKSLPYIVYLERDPDEVKRLIKESDLLLVGWNDCEHLLVDRLAGDRLTIRISERIYRTGQWKAISPRGLIRKYKEHIRYRKKPVYLLCNGAYVASDFSLIGAYPGKMFKFGYFPQTRLYAPKELDRNHDWGQEEGEKEIQLVWAGRFLPLKHPEFALKLAKSLKKRGSRFHLHLVGSGQMEEELRKRAEQSELEKEVTFYGFLPPDEVRSIMEKCHIHLFTSNHLEGWGAVVNEAMNSGCVPVASSQAGGPPFLIRHGENGLMYHQDSYEQFEACVFSLIQDPQKARRMGHAAYRTIIEEWNAGTAAGRLMEFYEQWKEGKILAKASGPFSPAERRKPENG